MGLSFTSATKTARLRGSLPQSAQRIDVGFKPCNSTGNVAGFEAPRHSASRYRVRVKADPAGLTLGVRIDPIPRPEQLNPSRFRGSDPVVHLANAKGGGKLHAGIGGRLRAALLG